VKKTSIEKYKRKHKSTIILRIKKIMMILISKEVAARDGLKYCCIHPKMSAQRDTIDRFLFIISPLVYGI